MQLNNKRLVILGLILIVSLTLTGCLSNGSPTNPEDDTEKDTKVWDTYNNAASFAVKYKSGWKTYEYEDVLGAIVNSLEDNQEFQQIIDSVEQEYNVNLEKEIYSLDELKDMVYKIDDVITEIDELRSKVTNQGLQAIFTQSEIDQLMSELNYSDPDKLREDLYWELTSLWAQLSALDMTLDELEQQLADSAFIVPKKLKFDFAAGTTTEESTAEIDNQFLFAASTVTETELLNQGMMMPSSKDEFYQYMQLYVENEYGNKVVNHGKITMDQSSYAAYKIELKYDSKAATEMGHKFTEIGIYKDGQAGFVRYQGTADGHDQYSNVAKEMAKSFQFK